MINICFGAKISLNDGDADLLVINYYAKYFIEAGSRDGSSQIDIFWAYIGTHLLSAPVNLQSFQGILKLNNILIMYLRNSANRTEVIASTTINNNNRL